MKQLLNPGKYVIAVSGGVDSVVLLNMLSNLSDAELIVAHFDHGIRGDSKKDRQFVEDLAKSYGLEFAYAEGQLGANASEDMARKARYHFLNGVVDSYGANAIVTAHHQDDVIETMILNIMRGTKRKGLSSLRSTDKIVRPLLGMNKSEILDYAKENNLEWREDSTNKDEKYLRNWVRKNVVSKLSRGQREALLQIYKNAEVSNKEIDDILSALQSSDKAKIEKKILRDLSHEEAKEFVAHWLRANKLTEFTNKQVEQIVVNAKTLQKGKESQVGKGYKVEYGDKFLELIKE